MRCRLVTHEKRRVLRLHPELPLEGRQGGREVGEEHALDDAEAPVEDHVHLETWKRTGGSSVNSTEVCLS